MEVFYYAELDANSIVQGVSNLAGEVIKPTMIRLQTYDETLRGKLYQNGAFVDAP